MLVLTRKKGQSIIIGGEIKVTVVEVSGETIRLGIDAPTHLEIYREEIFNQIREENTSAVADPKGIREILSKNIIKKK
ncbi:MAG: carbon storage regulator CsrA [Bacillota bacterium]